MEYKLENISVKIASALLVHRGEISTKDIEAIPFINNSKNANKTLTILANTFNVEIRSRKISSSPIPEWEQIVRLKNR